MQDLAIALGRVSTPEQLESHSLERQADNIGKAADELGVPIIKGWSGSRSSKAGNNVNRPDLLEMLEFCKRNKRVKYLIVDEIDRFMRSIDEANYWEVSFRIIGVKVYYASQPVLNGTDMMAKFQKFIELFKAESSNVERSTKSSNGLKAAVKAGRNTFPCHHGYKKTIEAGMHVPDYPRFGMLQDAIKKIIYEGFIPAQALRYLSEQGYRTPKGKELTITSFMRILRQPFYKGIIKKKNWEASQGLHQPMLTPEEFEKLQNIINGKRIKYIRKKENPEFPLNRIITCTECGEKTKFVGFNHQNGKGWSAPKYRCRGCNKQYKREDVHKAINKVLSKFDFGKSMKLEYAKVLKDVWVKNQADTYNRIRSMQQRLQVLEDQATGLTAELPQTPAEFKTNVYKAMEEKNKEIEQQKKDIADLENIEEDLIEFMKFGIDLVQNMQIHFWEIEAEDREKCKLLAFPEGISIDKELKVFTPKISPILSTIYTKKDPSAGDESLLVELRRVALLSKPARISYLHD